MFGSWALWRAGWLEGVLFPRFSHHPSLPPIHRHPYTATPIHHRNHTSIQVLKYMLLCKIMLGDSGDVPALLSAKAGAKHAGPAVDAMRAVARAHQERSLQAFQAVLAAYPEELGGDAIVHTHLSALYGTLLEQNLLRLIEPYSRVEARRAATRRAATRRDALSLRRSRCAPARMRTTVRAYVQSRCVFLSLSFDTPPTSQTRTLTQAHAHPRSPHPRPPPPATGRPHRGPHAAAPRRGGGPAVAHDTGPQAGGRVAA